MLNPEIVSYISQEILPRYAHFDQAHNIDHAETVISESLRLAKHFPEVNVNMVYVIAAYHDIGLSEGRERHHISSGIMLIEDVQLLRWFTIEQCLIMQEAVEDHRASAIAAPRSIYGRIVAEADRMIDTDITLRRTIQYGLKHLVSQDVEEHFVRFRSHLLEKYDEGGYMKLWIVQSENAARLQELRSLIHNDCLLREEFNRIFAEEVAKKAR